MVCAAVDLVDDVEDGDADAYLGDVPPAVRVNLAAQMWVLSALVVARLEAQDSDSKRLLPAILELSSAMACGQRIDLTRASWSVTEYARMTELTSARQLEIYARLAAFPARAAPAPFVAVVRPLGLLLQILHDEAVGDPRWTSLPVEPAERWRREAEEALQRACLDAPPASQKIVFALAETVGISAMPGYTRSVRAGAE